MKKINEQAYYYDLEKIKKFVIENDGIWELEEPPCGIIVYFEGTAIHIGNDDPYIEFDGEIEKARRIHHIGMTPIEKLKEKQK